MKRKLKKCVNRIHNGNPSCSVSSMTQTAGIRFASVKNGCYLSHLRARTNGEMLGVGSVASVKSMERDKFRAHGIGPARSCGHLQNLRKAHWETSCNEVAIENKMPDVDSYDSSSGIAVDVQQRLNCALPSLVL